MRKSKIIYYINNKKKLLLIIIIKRIFNFIQQFYIFF